MTRVYRRRFKKNDIAPRNAKLPGPRAASFVRKKPKVQPNSLVSDHAILRWIERILDMGHLRTAIEQEILAEGRAALIPTMVRGRIHLKHYAAYLCIDGGRVVTVTTDDMEER